MEREVVQPRLVHGLFGSKMSSSGRASCRKLVSNCTARLVRGSVRDFLFLVKRTNIAREQVDIFPPSQKQLSEAHSSLHVQRGEGDHVLAVNCQRGESFWRQSRVRRELLRGKRKGRRGRGAAGKVPVFGLLRRNGRIYTWIVRRCLSQDLAPDCQDESRA